MVSYSKNILQDSVFSNGIIRKFVVYIILSINMERKKYWQLVSVMNDLKPRWVKDVLIICVDGPTEIKETVAVTFLK